MELVVMVTLVPVADTAVVAAVASKAVEVAVAIPVAALVMDIMAAVAVVLGSSRVEPYTRQIK